MKFILEQLIARIVSIIVAMITAKTKANGEVLAEGKLDDIKNELIEALTHEFDDLKKAIFDEIKNSKYLDPEVVIELINKEIDDLGATNFIPYVPSSIENILMKKAVRYAVVLAIGSLKKFMAK